MHVTENIRPTAIGQASRGDDLLRFIFFLLGHIGPIIKTELLTHSYDFFFIILVESFMDVISVHNLVVFSRHESRVRRDTDF